MVMNRNVTTTGVFYNSFDTDFNRTVVLSAQTAAQVLVGLAQSLH